jgi:dipeptidyl aminopeptidase/acylaminoacyl peptidase
MTNVVEYMKAKLLPFILFLICTLSIYGQKKQPITEIYATPVPVQVGNPIQIDTVDIKGKKFSDENLLKMNLAIPEQSSFTKTVSASMDNWFLMEKPEKGASLHLFSFLISTDEYAKGTLRITSPNMFEVYVDDKLSKSKTTKEDSIKGAKDITVSVIPYPKTSRVVIKLLSSENDKTRTCFKLTVEKSKEEDPLFRLTKSDKRRVDFTDIILGKRLTNTRISPNGQYALLSYRNTLGEKSITSTELYNISSGKRVSIGDDKKQLSWMPASEKLYYVETIDESRNLITIDPATLEETVIARNVPKESFSISPDEKTLFFYIQQKGEEPKGDLKLLLSPNDRQPNYRNESFIYRYDIATGLSQQLTFGSNTTSISSISPDSKKLLFSVSKETITERPFRKSSMYMLDLETMAVDTLWSDQTFAYGASFSPDGKSLLISGAPEAFDGIGLNIDEGQIANSYDTQAFILDLSTRKIDPITKDFDPSIDRSVWNKYDGMIYFTVTEKDYVRIYQYNPKNKKYTLIPASEEVIRTASYAQNAPVGVYMGVSTANTTKAYTIDLKTQKSVLISDPDKEHQSQLIFGETKDWNFQNSEGTIIYGRYYLPPAFDNAKTYPMIVYYYGGTTPTSRSYEHNYPPHVYAALGYVVYVIQPAGATGFGQKFSAMHVNAWGQRTAEDIIEGTQKFVRDHAFVNGSKIGCIGASYGGFMTMYLQTRTDMFAAAVSHAGISSLSSYWGEGYWGFSYSSGASAHSYPWNNWDLYVKQSPLFNADKVKTPLLLLHGAVDTNVPPGESIQMYTALKILGKPVELIEVKGENHVIANYKRRLEWMNSVMAWFDRWLKDEPDWWKSLYPNSPTLKEKE